MRSEERIEARYAHLLNVCVQAAPAITLRVCEQTGVPHCTRELVCENRLPPDIRMYVLREQIASRYAAGGFLHEALTHRHVNGTLPGCNVHHHRVENGRRTESHDIHVSCPDEQLSQGGRVTCDGCMLQALHGTFVHLARSTGEVVCRRRQRWLIANVAREAPDQHGHACFAKPAQGGRQVTPELPDARDIGIITK